MGMAPWQLGRGVVGGFSKPRLIGSGVPSDSLGELGNYYYDSSANRWYLKRWVVQDISGFTDLVTFPVPATHNGLAAPFSIEFVAYNTYTTNSNMIKSGRLEVNSRSVALNAIYIELKNDGGGVQTTCDAAAPGLAWNKIRVAYDATNGLSVYVNGVSVAAVPTPTWNVTTPATNVVVLSPVGGYGSKYCSLSVSDINGKKIDAPLDDGSGLIARNLSWGGDGVLTTAGVWAASWVPMDLLT